MKTFFSRDCCSLGPCFWIWVWMFLFANCSSQEKFECDRPIVSVATENILGMQVGELVLLKGGVRLPPEDKNVCKTGLSFVTVRWEQVEGPTVELAGADQPEASFTPNETGTYKFRFKATYPKASDPAKQESNPVTVTVEVVACQPDPPVAEAGEDQVHTHPPVTVSLHGEGSQASLRCKGVSLQRYAWSLVSKPSEAPEVSLANASQAIAQAELTTLGDYVFQLEVEDSEGNTAQDTILVSLLESPSCGSTLKVSVINASDRKPLSGVQLTVVDAAGATHTSETSNGIFTFNALAEGVRASITARSNETVPALPDSGDSNPRPLYEMTTVLDTCNENITIPLRLTRSGQSAIPTGTVVAKVPSNIFSMLPHSWKCVGACETDAQCDTTYYCETTEGSCKNLCTPRSLLPFFTFGGENRSGQFRVASLFRIHSFDNFTEFPLDRIFGTPVNQGALLPGNLSTDDIFLNGVAAPLGYQVWGKECVRNTDCNPGKDAEACARGECDYLCEEDPERNRRSFCKDMGPMRHLKLKVPANQEVVLGLVTGIIDVSLGELLPILLSFFGGGDSSTNLDIAGMLGAFSVRTLHVCPIQIKVSENETKDISSEMVKISRNDCWNVEYLQQEVVESVWDEASISSKNECDQDKDCTEDQRCLKAPGQEKKYCVMRLFRVRIVTEDALSIKSTLSGFDPTSVAADGRLQAALPSQADYVPKCEGENGVLQACPTPVHCTIPITPENTECSIPYGISLLSLNIKPSENPQVPLGGRVLLGFSFNYTPYVSVAEPRFFSPALASVKGASYETTQMFFRNSKMNPDASYRTLPGHVGASATSQIQVGWMKMPKLTPLPALVPPPTDTGFEVLLTLVPQDPVAGCASVVFKRIYAYANRLLHGTAGVQNLPSNINVSQVPNDGAHGLLLSRVDRITIQETIYTLDDPMWRIYAPADRTTFDLPSTDLFNKGQEVWITLWQASFSQPYYHDLFPTEHLLTGQKVIAQDSYSTIIP